MNHKPRPQNLSFARSFCRGFVILTFVLSLLLLSTKAVQASVDGSLRIIVANSGNLVQGCSYSADVFMSTGNNNSNSADVIVNFDPSKVEIIDSQPGLVGTQIKTGLVYESYFGNQVDQIGGKINLTGASFSDNFRGDGLFATIQFRGKSGATNGAFNIEFLGSGNTYDSNIAVTETSQDALGTVSNASFTFVPGSCLSDTTAPVVNFEIPSSSSSVISTDTAIKFNIVDNASGTNISKLEVLVNGVSYLSTNPLVKISGSPDNYSIIVNQDQNIFINGPSSILVKATDFAGNFRQSFLSFNFPPPVSIIVTSSPIQPTSSSPVKIITPTPVLLPGIDNLAPVITFINPISRQTISSNSEIVFKVSNIRKMINLDSLQIFLNEKKYTKNDVILNIAGDSNEYIITIKDSFDFSKTTPSYLTIFVANVNGGVAANNIIFNIPPIMQKEDDYKNAPPPVCKPEPPPIGVVSNPPFSGTVNNVQEKTDELTPFALKKFVRNAGVFGLVSIILGMALVVRFLYELIRFISSGLFLPLLRSTFTSKNRKYGFVINAQTREKLSLVRVEIVDPVTELSIAHSITNFSGRYYISLEAGIYRLIFWKRGYFSRVIEINLQKPTVIEKSIELKESGSKNIVKNEFISPDFKWLRISMYFITALSALNLLYVKTPLSIVIFGIILFLNMCFALRIKTAKLLPVHESNL